mmetsp:Transcript_75150/g.209021  ORF Transcript_75150/g.209021 Transcript_75150/m.209021 type:complete len:355 (-) Transcript_75150:922-1986(-)
MAYVCSSRNCAKSWASLARPLHISARAALSSATSSTEAFPAFFESSLTPPTVELVADDTVLASGSPLASRGGSDAALPSEAALTAIAFINEASAASRRFSNTSMRPTSTFSMRDTTLPIAAVSSDAGLEDADASAFSNLCTPPSTESSRAVNEATCFLETASNCTILLWPDSTFSSSTNIFASDSAKLCLSDERVASGSFPSCSVGFLDSSCLSKRLAKSATSRMLSSFWSMASRRSANTLTSAAPLSPLSTTLATSALPCRLLTLVCMASRRELTEDMAADCILFSDINSFLNPFMLSASCTSAASIRAISCCETPSRRSAKCCSAASRRPPTEAIAVALRFCSKSNSDFKPK